MFRRGFKSWCENVALQQRKNLSLGPLDPLNPYDLAKSLKLILWYPSDIQDLSSEDNQQLTKRDPDSWSAITIFSGSLSAIILNPTHSKARIASDLMHEIAHALLAHKPARVDVTESGLLILNSFDSLQEDEANWLAGSLLLPRTVLLHIHSKRIPQIEAQKTYFVSEAMFNYRWRVTGVENQIRNRRKFFPVRSR